MAVISNGPLKLTNQQALNLIKIQKKHQVKATSKKA
ncbi:hypothetical protein IGJ44_002853 [Enterococcus sp. DIV1368d]